MQRELSKGDPMSRSIIDLAAVSKIKDIPLKEASTSRQQGVVKT